ncbi:STAS domain-containing protein [Longispora urticae]
MTCVELPVPGDIIRLSVYGDVTAEDSASLMHAILKAVAGSEDRRVVVDLADANLTDHVITEVLVAARDAARVVCRDLTFTGAPSRIRADLARHDGPRVGASNDGRPGPAVGAH